MQSKYWVSLHKRRDDVVIRADVCLWHGGETVCICDSESPEENARMIVQALDDAERYRWLREDNAREYGDPWTDYLLPCPACQGEQRL